MMQTLIALDQTVNTLIWARGEGFGMADETLSARMWRLRERLALGAPMEKTAEMLTQLNKRIDAIYQDRMLSPQRKREMLDEILGQRAELARSAVEQRRMMKAAM